MNRPEAPGIPDVQSHPDAREIAIDRVGIRGLRYPMQFADGGSAPQPTVACCNVYVALPAEHKGTHMSRLVAVVDEMRDPLSLAGMSTLLDTMLHRLDADGGRIEIEFPWFMRKTAPVSGVPSMMDYQVRLSADHTAGKRTIIATVVVPVMSLCPSSKAISDYGAHNQRSHLTLSLRPRPGGSPISMAELVGIAEEEASCELYGLLKREDEKYVTERAYDRPRFVEDLVRGVAARMAGDARFESFSVAAENFESIHNHSAYAEIVRGM
jgi:GTP cyclohydrolase IB